MKKKGYYIHFEGRKIAGIAKKIDAQLKELNKDLICEEIQLEAKERSVLQRIWGLMPFASIPWKYDKAWKNIDNPGFVYVRRANADRNYMRFLSGIKKSYPDCKIIMELPTYPYDKDGFARWDAWPFFIKDVYFRRQYRKYIDCFATYSADDEIFGVPTIKTMNGLDVEAEKVISLQKKEDRIDLLAVAFMQKHHGYERIIKGLKDYYCVPRNIKVYLHMVGEGPEKAKYEAMVSKWKLKEYVIFYGSKKGEELDKIYNGKDIAITSLGMYKLGINTASVLKSREYLAKGIPMITGCDIDVLNEAFPYYIEFPNDSSSIDIDKVVTFYQSIFSVEDVNQITENIRAFAYNNIDMKVVMRPIVEYIVKPR